MRRVSLSCRLIRRRGFLDLLLFALFLRCLFPVDPLHMALIVTAVPRNLSGKFQRCFCAFLYFLVPCFKR
jgi:hypothetical protein